MVNTYFDVVRVVIVPEMVTTPVELTTLTTRPPDVIPAPVTVIPGVMSEDSVVVKVSVVEPLVALAVGPMVEEGYIASTPAFKRAVGS
jgi:hypothetical protein